MDYVYNFRALEILFLLAFQQPPLLFGIVYLALFNFLLHNFEHSHFYFFLEQGFIHIPDVSACLIEGALNVFPDKIFKKRSSSNVFADLETFDRKLKGLLIGVDDNKLVS